MKSTYKKLITDITRKKDIEENLTKYLGYLNDEYNAYSTVKMCMNYYTMKEMLEEYEDKNTDVCKYFAALSKLLNKHVEQGETCETDSLEAIRTLRDSVEYKMKVLTAFTDGYEVYEYILNRVEAGIKGTITAVDPDALADKMFRYVFLENDTVVINSKLQLLISQLPVRMTKMKFFDIIGNTFKIYEAGDKTAFDEFVEMLRTSVLIVKPKGFETEYPYLYSVYSDLTKTDFPTLTMSQFEELFERLKQASLIINQEVSAYMLLQEIINDVYTILLTIDSARLSNESREEFRAAVKIICTCLNQEHVEDAMEELFSAFASLEGAQESLYENIAILESALPDFSEKYKDEILKAGFSDKVLDLKLASKLLSTSIFIDLDRDYDGIATELCSHDYIVKQQESFVAELDGLFKAESRMVQRSMMCKLLSAMPVFMNSQQEIKDYFSYVLHNCKNDSELTACYHLINELIEEE